MLVEFIYPHGDGWLRYRELSRVCSWNSYWKRSGVPIGPSFGRKFHTNGFPLIRIQNSHRPVGLHPGMPMETAGLAVHLHVYTARGLDFWQIKTNHARLFSYENLHGVKCVHFCTFFKGATSSENRFVWKFHHKLFIDLLSCRMKNRAVRHKMQILFNISWVHFFCRHPVHRIEQNNKLSSWLFLIPSPEHWFLVVVHKSQSHLAFWFHCDQRI